MNQTGAKRGEVIKTVIISAAAALFALPVFAQNTPMPGMPEMTSESKEPTDRWMTMLHGFAFLNANRQGGPSGGRELDAQNHVMAMATRSLGGGRITLLGTFTLEPATIPPDGSRQLFQRGETYHNILLVDRQHPHDLFVQVAAAWERDLSSNSTLRAYLAPVGEPALGPEAYPHRLSASENPTAPLSHHNQDSTHIAADVATLGLTVGPAAIEGSVFHGREPDENRWNVDQGRPDSWSGRLTVRPLTGVSLQISTSHLEHPEKIESGNQTRSTASVSYERETAGGFIAASLIAGRNRTRGGPEWGNLFEFTWKFAEKNFLYGRVEAVDRDIFELVNKRQRPEEVPPARTSVRAATLGFVRDIPLLTEAETGLGADATVYGFTRRLDAVYGAHPVSVHAFLRVRYGGHGEPGIMHSH
jgi:hypothetical protein